MQKTTKEKRAEAFRQLDQAIVRCDEWTLKTIAAARWLAKYRRYVLRLRKKIGELDRLIAAEAEARRAERLAKIRSSPDWIQIQNPLDPPSPVADQGDGTPPPEGGGPSARG